MRLIPEEPPPGPARPGFWRSPVRSTYLTTVIGLALLVTIIIVSLTGFLSHAAYQPDLGRNALIPRADDLQLFVIPWPTSPSWLYAFTQGSHVTFGFVLIPLLLFKLWSVIPKLFTWPPPTKPSEALGKLANLLLVGSAFFQVMTGLTNGQLYYPWHFNFVVAHYYGAWIFTAAVAFHVIVRVPTMREARRTRNDVLGMPDDPLRTPNPGPTTINRRGVLGLLGGVTGAVFLTTVGQSAGGPLRQLALLAPRGRGEGLDGTFPVNKTAAVARITPEMVGEDWRLKVVGAGGREIELTRAQLQAMPQRTEDLPIACVEGWSSTQTWTGVRLSDLAALVDADDPATMHVVSLQPAGAFKQTTIGRRQVGDDRSLLALQVAGADLSLDHGYPARLIVPALPGVHNTKWVSTVEFA